MSPGEQLHRQDAAGPCGGRDGQHRRSASGVQDFAEDASPQYAGLAERADADGQQRSAAKEDRKAFEFADRRDDAADNIATRYATMARAGLTVKDLQWPALDRLAIKDSRDLLLIDGFPPHPRAGEAKALVADSLKSDAYRATFEREAAEWATPGVGRQPGLPARTALNESLDQASAATAFPCGCEAKCQDSSISRASCGSPEFVRQAWVAATAQGLKAVGHRPTAGDRCGREQRATPACGRD